MDVYPDGKAGDDDEGATPIAIGSENGVVKIVFMKPMTWIGLDPATARSLARLLDEYANRAATQREGGRIPVGH